ncbi:MAG: fumarate reductase subunit C [Vicinamibacterales bacterium]
MAQGDGSTAYHPRWLRPRMSTYWWLEKPAYLLFMLREGSCMFVGWFTAYLLLLLRAVQQGPAVYEEFLAWSATPSIVALNVVSFAFLLFHAITFFQATPQAMIVRVGRRRLPGGALLAAHYAAWLVASVVVCWLLVGA